MFCAVKPCKGENKRRNRDECQKRRSGRTWQTRRAWQTGRTGTSAGSADQNGIYFEKKINNSQRGEGYEQSRQKA